MKDGLVNKIFLGAIALVGIIIAFLIASVKEYKLSESHVGSYTGINFAYLVAFILLIAGIGAILFFVAKAIKNKPNSIKVPSMGLAAIIVIFFIAKMMDAGELLPTYADFDVTTTSQSQNVGGLIGLMWTMLGLSLLAIVGYFVLKLTRNN